MMDQANDPVGYAACQDAGRVGGIAAANDREDLADLEQRRADHAALWADPPAGDRYEATILKAGHITFHDGEVVSAWWEYDENADPADAYPDPDAPGPFEGGD